MYNEGEAPAAYQARTSTLFCCSSELPARIAVNRTKVGPFWNCRAPPHRPPMRGRTRPRFQRLGPRLFLCHARNKQLVNVSCGDKALDWVERLGIVAPGPLFNAADDTSE